MRNTETSECTTLMWSCVDVVSVFVVYNTVVPLFYGHPIGRSPVFKDEYFILDVPLMVRFVLTTVLGDHRLKYVVFLTGRKREVVL